MLPGIEERFAPSDCEDEANRVADLEHEVHKAPIPGRVTKLIPAGYPTALCFLDTLNNPNSERAINIVVKKKKKAVQVLIDRFCKNNTKNF